MTTGANLIKSDHAGSGYTAQATQQAAQNFRTLIEQYQHKTIDDFLNAICDRIIANNQLRDIKRIRTWKRNRDFYIGGQIGHWDTRTGLWVVDEPDPADHAFPVNQYGYFIRSVQALWTRSQTRYQIKPRHDDPMVVGAAKIGTMVIDDCFSRRWREVEKQIECKNAQITGNYFRQLCWMSDADVPAWVPTVEELTVAGEDEGYLCYECGMEGSASGDEGGTMTAMQAMSGAYTPEMEAGSAGNFCAHCGSENIERFGLPATTIKIVTGHEQVEGGDVLIDPIDPIECRMHDHARRFEQSPYFSRTRLFLVEILQSKFPGIQMPYASSTDIRLLYHSALESNVGFGMSGGRYGDLAISALEGLVEFQEFWLTPEMYIWYVTPDTATQESGTVRTDPMTKFIEMYPKGLYLSRIGGKLTGLPVPENKNDYIVHGRFDVVPNTVWGRGQDDAVTENEAANFAENLWFDILMNYASGMTGYDPDKINPEDITGSPEDLIPVNNLMGEPLSNFIWQAPGRGAPPDLPAFIAAKYENMQRMFAAFPAMQGDSEGRSETATRTAILRDQGTMMHGSALALKAECDVATVERALKLYQQNWFGKRFFFSKGMYDDFEGQYFESADIQGDFTIEAVPGSYLPKSDGEKRAAIIEAATIGGVPGGVFNPQFFSPKLRRTILEDMGITYDVDDVAPDYRKQKLEIKRLEELIEQVLDTFAQMGVPDMLPAGTLMADGMPAMEPEPNPVIVSFLLKQIPVERMTMPGMPAMRPAPTIDNNQIHIQCIDEWLKSDKGIQAHPVLRAALMAHSLDHFQAEIETQQFMSMGQIAAGAPEQMAAAADAEDQARIEAEAQGKSSGGDKGKVTAQPSEANVETDTARMEAALPAV